MTLAGDIENKAIKGVAMTDNFDWSEFECKNEDASNLIALIASRQAHRQCSCPGRARNRNRNLPQWTLDIFMNKPDFATMTRSEFRQYILEHREDDEALSIYAERFRDPNAKVYLPNQGLNDPDVATALREHLEQKRNQA
jgi:hypothetical protein